MRTFVVLLLCACGESTPAHHDLYDFAAHKNDPATQDIELHIRASLSKTSSAYDETLARMKAHGADAVKVLVDEYHAQPEGQYFRRWLLVHTLGKVEHASAMGLWSELLLRTPPPEHGDPHAASTAEEEGLIHLAAVEGVAHVAKAGNGDALALLQTVADMHPDPAVAQHAHHLHDEAMP